MLWRLLVAAHVASTTAASSRALEQLGLTEDAGNADFPRRTASSPSGYPHASLQLPSSAAHTRALLYRAVAQHTSEPFKSVQARAVDVHNPAGVAVDEYNASAVAICDGVANANTDAQWSALMLRAMQLNKHTGMQTKEECEADGGLAHNASFCVPDADGLQLHHETGIPLDAYYCGSPAIDWTNLTGDAGKPMADMCRLPLDAEAYTYRPDGSILTCYGRTTEQILKDWCNIYVYLSFGAGDDLTAEHMLQVNRPVVGCLYGGANCERLYCQTCDGMCARTP